MTVRELKSKLCEFPDDATVILYQEDWYPLIAEGIVKIKIEDNSYVELFGKHSI